MSNRVLNQQKVGPSSNKSTETARSLGSITEMTVSDNNDRDADSEPRNESQNETESDNSKECYTEASDTRLKIF